MRIPASFWTAVKFLNSRTAVFYVILALSVHAFCALAVIRKYNFNPTALLRFGNYYVEQNRDLTPSGSVFFSGNEEHGGNGYDGQIFYFYARSLFIQGKWPVGFSNAYRAPRIGYPALAALFTPFGSYGVFLGMLFWQYLLSGISVFLLHRLLSTDLKYLTIFFALSPFSIQSVNLLVSDSVVVSLVVIGYYFFHHRNFIASFLFFSLALLTKESSLFFLFPLGLCALLKKDFRASALLVLVLLPFAAWQIYLKEAHGFLPAGILKIFLSPFDGIIGLAKNTFSLTVDTIQDRGASAGALFKIGARVLLFFLLPAGFYAVFSSRARSSVPFRLQALLLFASILIADYYYFWGIFENVGRMFSLVTPVFILLKNEDRDVRSGLFFGILIAISALVVLRIVFLSPAFPFDLFETYNGPQYPGAPVPGKF